MTKDEIKALALECGFTLREQPDGRMDLNPYVYDFAEKLAFEQFSQMRSDGWRQCAKGQNTSQFCGQLEEAVKALRIEVEQLKTERNRSGVELRNAVAKAVREEHQRQRDKIEAHIGRSTMSVYGTQPECKAARDALQRLLEDDA
jgi:hypothetical protein